MTREEMYDAWAPAESIWSPWVKPVLFAHCGGHITQPTALPTMDTSFADRADGSTAYVIDLSALHSAVVGIELATKGYRPVPLFNACPSPGVSGSDTMGRAIAAVDLRGCIDALEGGAPVLRASTLTADAPPAFLLDAQRRYGSGIHLNPGMFDNRSVSLPTDFPSANFLLAHGIRRVVLVQDQSLTPQEDLAHTLLRWQEAGIEIAATSVLAAGVADAPLPPSAKPIQPIRVTKPSLFRSLLHRVLATAGLRRNPLGGFGGLLPIPSSHGGIG